MPQDLEQEEQAWRLKSRQVAATPAVTELLKYRQISLSV